MAGGAFFPLEQAPILVVAQYLSAPCFGDTSMMMHCPHCEIEFSFTATSGDTYEAIVLANFANDCPVMREMVDRFGNIRSDQDACPYINQAALHKFIEWQHKFWQ